jgi:parallel beta-helix repeat protein
MHQRFHRRDFLRKSTLAAALLGTGAAAHSATAATGAGAPPGVSPWLSASDFGVAGDGSTDDTAALRRAIAEASQQKAAGVYLRAGTYMLSDALALPSNFQLIGAGRDLTVLKAVPGTLFPKFRPDPRTVELRQRRTLLTTTGAGTVRQELVRNILVAQLTLDWSHCPTEGFGHSVALMDSVDHGVIREVAFINCLPEDHPRTADEVRAGGANFRCECLMYSNSRHGLIERCLLTDSGYRPLSVSYGSRGIRFRDGVILAEKPVWRHAFSENHGDGIARDGSFVRSQLIFQDSTFILLGGTPADGICSHTGTTVVNNCDFYIENAPTTFTAILRAFDGSHNCQYTANRFHCDGNHRAAFSLMTTTPRTSPTRGPDEAIVFAGNIADISFGDAENDRRRALIQLQGTDRRARIADNILRVQWKRGSEGEVIRLEKNSTFAVTGNQMEIQATEGATGATGIVVEDCNNGNIAGNVIHGTFAHGIRLLGDARGVVVANNVLSETSGEESHRSPE